MLLVDTTFFCMFMFGRDSLVEASVLSFIPGVHEYLFNLFDLLGMEECLILGRC